MITNSPYPVDGDVQCYQMPLLTEGERDKAIRDFTVRSVNTDCDVSLLAYQIALASLTAKPYAYASRNIDMSKESQYFSASVFNNVWGYEYTVPLYTTPPAQLLRPVELPTGCTSGYSSPGCDEIFIRKSELISALRQQGYEVKS